MPMTSTGFVPYTPQQAFQAVVTLFSKVFNQQPDTTPGNPTSQFIQEISNMLVNSENSQSLLYSDIYNPQNTTGVFADGLCALTNLQRQPATYTIVTCQLTGIAGTVIPANSIVLDVNNNQFQNLTAITLGTGTTTAVFTALIAGNIAVAANTLTKIQNNIPGWSTINNMNAGIAGSSAQSDTSLLNTRNYTLALNSTAWSEALQSALVNFLAQNGTHIDPTYGYPYVQGFYIFENNSNIAVNIPNTTISINPFTVYIVIYAPNFLFNADNTQNATNSQYVAGLILRVKSGGCQTQNIQSGNNAFSINYNNPNYAVLANNIKWDSPTAIPIQFNISVTVFNNTLSPTTIKTTIQSIVVNQFYNGYGSYPPINMVENINANNFIPAIIAKLGNINITNITIQQVDGGSPQNIFPALLPTQIATLISTNINVTITVN